MIGTPNSKFILGFLFLILLSTISCQDADDVASAPTGGRCYISKNSSSMICIEFADGSDANTNSTTCSTEYSRYQSSHSANGQDFASGDGNNCDTSSKVGSCQVGANVFYYMSSVFDATTAQSDCTSVQSGTWSL